jgi:hypothetical protein
VFDFDAVFDAVKVFALFVACAACCQSIRRTVESRDDRQWLCTMQALERDGLWRIGPFEPAIPEVRLSDLTHAHRCPSCERGVGR